MLSNLHIRLDQNLHDLVNDYKQDSEGKQFGAF